MKRKSATIIDLLNELYNTFLFNNIILLFTMIRSSSSRLHLFMIQSYDTHTKVRLYLCKYNIYNVILMYKLNIQYFRVLSAYLCDALINENSNCMYHCKLRL